MRGSRVANERGIALAVAVFALVVIGALVAGAFFAGRLEQQTGQNTFYANQAAEAAEAALAQTLDGFTLTSATMLAMPAPSGLVTVSTVSLGGKTTATSYVRRLTSSVWLLTAEGKHQNAAGTDMATRSVGQLIRLNEPELTFKGGLTAIGKISLSGNSTVSGNDVTPPDWGGLDCPPLDSVAGVYYNGQVTQQGSATVTGDPPQQQDSTLNSGNMLGNSSFDQLKAAATLILTGNISGIDAATKGDPPVCDTSIENNWGAPTVKTSPCFSYFPIIYRKGDLFVQGNGQGQGILLVEGNLNVQGTIDFYGPVIVTGGVNIKGTGTDDVKFFGGVMAQDVTLDDQKLSGNAQVNFSSCAIRRALQGSAKPIPLTERSWVQLYN
jgi:hypothetical protein